MRRIAAGKSKGTILMVLLILSIVGYIFDLVKSFSVITLITTLLNAYSLLLVIKARNEA